MVMSPQEAIKNMHGNLRKKREIVQVCMPVICGKQDSNSAVIKLRLSVAKVAILGYIK